MNRNVLKIIALLSMIIDHIGLLIFPNIILFRVVGRLAFPVFAFFVSEGLKFTKSRKKYVLTLLVCGLLTQIPYSFLYSWYKLNIIFTFLVAILIIYLIEKNNKQNFFNVIYLLVAGLLLIAVEYFGVVDYGIFGVMLVVVFYFIKNKALKFALAALILCLLSLKMMFLSSLFFGLIQLTSLISLILLMFYNQNKGKLNLKYIFYIFYPSHFYVFLLISFI